MLGVLEAKLLNTEKIKPESLAFQLPPTPERHTCSYMLKHSASYRRRKDNNASYVLDFIHPTATGANSTR